MRTAPIISLGLSIVVGIAAVVFGRGWLNSEADATNAPAVIVEEVATQDILVADLLLQRGDLLTEDSFTTVAWPAEHLPTGALTDVASITRPDGSFPYALGVVLPGEPLLGGKLSPVAVRDTLAALIEPGYRAVSIEVDDATGVAGFVLPDTRVDVNMFTDIKNRATGETTSKAKTLLQDVRVLAVDQLFHESIDGAAPARTVTLQVTPEQAHDLGSAVGAGRIGLALRGKDDVTILPPPEPVRPRRVITRRAAPKKTTATIRVIQGDEETTVSAPVARTRSATEGQN